MKFLRAWLWKRVAIRRVNEGNRLPADTPLRRQHYAEACAAILRGRGYTRAEIEVMVAEARREGSNE